MTPDIDKATRRRNAITNASCSLGVVASVTIASFCGDHAIIRFLSMSAAVVLVVIMFEICVTKLVASDEVVSHKWDGLK
ncbi:hypothetical protein [Acetobacter persici]|uniref:Uncharacterized protein n=1 Tax=Acetobacter persici TaxID=1076596 RepID=A0A1U9LJV1_9PROT|nr:hypothetical protein [Acetobacter persici]AQT06678.1 hypothetical protein A0U91_16875 [Acetobacter persici]